MLSTVIVIHHMERSEVMVGYTGCWVFLSGKRNANMRFVGY